jgi:hypothetical protein
VILIASPIDQCFLSEARRVHRHSHIAEGCKFTEPETLVNFLKLSPNIPLDTVVESFLVIAENIMVFE